MKIMCHNCFSELQLTEPYERCRRCFYAFTHCSTSHHNCFKRDLPLQRYAFCFEESYIIPLLLKFLEKEDSKESINALASFLVVQHIRLDFPKPDCIILLPSFYTLLYKPSFGIALCRLLKVSTFAILHKSGKMTYKHLSPNKSAMKHALIIHDRTLLHSVPAYLSTLKGFTSYDWLSLYDK